MDDRLKRLIRNQASQIRDVDVYGTNAFNQLAMFIADEGPGRLLDAYRPLSTHPEMIRPEELERILEGFVRIITGTLDAGFKIRHEAESGYRWRNLLYNQNHPTELQAYFTLENIGVVETGVKSITDHAAAVMQQNNRREYDRQMGEFGAIVSFGEPYTSFTMFVKDLKEVRTAVISLSKGRDSDGEGVNSPG